VWETEARLELGQLAFATPVDDPRFDLGPPQEPRDVGERGPCSGTDDTETEPSRLAHGSITA
jgi:hypothetical protein